MRTLFLHIMIFLTFIVFSQEFEFKIMSYSKDGYRDDYYTVYKYVFENRVLSSIQITEYYTGNMRQETVYIRRNQNSIEVRTGGNLVLMTCTTIREGSVFLIKRSGSNNDFFVSLEDDGIIYAGIGNDITKRLIRIKKSPENVFFMFRENDFIYYDFEVTNAEESGIRFLEYDGHYQKTSDGFFEMQFEGPSYPTMKCSFQKSEMQYEFNIIDIFIDYFFGSEMMYPIIWGQLILNASYSDCLLDNSWQYTASSFLQEGSTKYVPENLAATDGNPWASANGFGIGDIITITMPVRSEESLVIYNGFQSQEKPYLYAQNSRVKEIEITYREVGTYKAVHLLDTPEAQSIDISDILENVGENATIDIKILSVYPGEKYEDVCIQAIIPEE